jgi:hypothetical protein
VLPATALTGNVPSQHLMCPVPSAGRRRQGHPAGDAPAGYAGKQCAHAERRAILIFSSARSFPSMPRMCRSPASGHGKIAPATNIRSFKCYIYICPWAHMSGPSPFVNAPLSAIKGEARDATRERSLRPNFRQTLTSSYKLPSNTSHSGVGYYALVARTTLNPRVLACIDPPVS